LITTACQWAGSLPGILTKHEENPPQEEKPHLKKNRDAHKVAGTKGQ